MKRIAVISYAISPFNGSESSVGWNYVTHMNKCAELYVFYGTSSLYVGDIKQTKDYVEKHKLSNVHFIPILIKENFWNSCLRKLYRYNFKLPFYFQYKEWHRRVYDKVYELVEKGEIDIIHYLNPIGFKEPGYCWKIKLPYIWGPLQGVHNCPYALLPALSFIGKMEALIRLVFHNYFLYCSRNVRNAMLRADVLLRATAETQVQVEKEYGRLSLLLPENGISKMKRSLPISYKPKSQKLRLIFIGELCQRKAVIITLNALSVMPKRYLDKVEFVIVGGGKEEKKLRNYVVKNHLSDIVRFTGKIPRADVDRYLAQSHLHLITSVGEGNPTVVWEAMSWAVPTLSLDHCGMATVVDSDCGFKISMQSYSQILNDICNSIIQLIENPHKVSELSMGVINKSKDYMWDNRVDVFQNAYKEAINHFKIK